MKNLSVSLMVLMLGFGSVFHTHASQSWAYTYNAQGQIITEDGPRTDVSDINTYTYDAQGNRTSFTNPLNHVINYTSYDAAGRLLSVTDANGVITTFTYHVRGWLTSSTLKHPSNNSALNAVTTYSYDAVGQMTGMVLPNGNALTFVYDDARRLTAVINAVGERINYTLDAAGNRTTETIKDSTGTIRYSVARAFDELSRVRDIVGNNNQHEQLGYDVNNNNTVVTDGNSHTTSQEFDALDRVTKVIDPTQNETQLTYNAQGQIETVTDAKGLVTTYHYDGLGNLTSLISPDTGTTTFTYDNAGNRTSATDARGVVVNYTYDALNRLKTVNYPASSSENLTLTYDASSSSTKGIGRLAKIVKTGTSVTYSYDHLGLVRQKQTTTSGVSKSIQYIYDSAGNLKRLIYPSLRMVDYFYDAQGRVNKITTRLGSGATQTLIYGATYIPFGPADNFVYGNGLTHTKNYDLDYRLTSIQVGGIVDRNYDYDSTNNITSIINNVNSSKTQFLDYDQLNRLISASGGYGNLEYTYDAVGNRLSETRDGTTDIYGYASTSHRLSMITRSSGNRNFSYDAAGNPTQRTGEDNSSQTTTFNHANRLSSVSINGAPAATYLYNGLGQRVMKTLVNGTKEIYYYDEAGQLISVTNGTGTTLREYIYWGNEQIAFVNNGVVHYVHNDHLNTPQVVTNAAQQVVWMGDYEPFGKLAAGQTNSIELYSRFPGQYLDGETGLYYNYFRDYDPSIGRYIQSDPIGLNGGINTYAYVSSNPLKYIDPFGLMAWQCQRPLGDTSGENGAGPPVFNHQYACVTLADGSIRCDSTNNPKGDKNPLTPAPGASSLPEDDNMDNGRCEQIDDDNDQCFEECMVERWDLGGRPGYAIGPLGTDCQEYTPSLIRRCQNQCMGSK